MKILITGGAGYIGSHTIIELLELTDWEVVSIDDYSNSSPETYNRIKNIASVDIPHFDVDLKDRSALRKVFEEHSFDGIIHFAAFKAVGESVDNPLMYYENNIGGLVNLLDCQKEFGVRHQLFSSSCTVYGSSAQSPVTENEASGNAESPYGFTKVIGERILSDFAATGDYNILALRYFNPVGAHMSGQLGELPIGVPNNLVPYITQTAAGIREELTIFGGDYDTRDGTCVRDYIHVTDIARAHILGLKHLLDNKQVQAFDYINLGTGNGVTVKEAVDAFMEVNKVDLKYKIGPRRAGDIAAIYADNSKAAEVLGWHPELSLNQMMESAWKWQEYVQA